MAKLSDPEPVLWSLFGAGGMVSAFLVPIHLLMVALLLPLGVVQGAYSHEALSELVANPMVKLYLLVLICLPLFTAAHRFRFTLHEFNLKGSDGLYAPLLYGSAVMGTVAAAWVVFSV